MATSRGRRAAAPPDGEEVHADDVADEAVDLPPHAEVGEAVEGTLLTAVVPTPAEQNKAADRARGRTAIQVGIPTAIVGLGTYFAKLKHWDLDPGPGTDMPADVVGYFIALITAALAFRMNPKVKDEG